VAQTVARDVSEALERDPQLDLAAYVREEYARDTQPFFILLRGGRSIENGGPFPETIVQEARARLEMIDRGDFERFGRGRPPGAPFGRGDMGGRGGMLPRTAPPGARGGNPGFRLARPA